MVTITGYRNIDKNCLKKSKSAELIEPKLYMNEHYIIYKTVLGCFYVLLRRNLRMFYYQKSNMAATPGHPHS